MTAQTVKLSDVTGAINRATTVLRILYLRTNHREYKCCNTQLNLPSVHLRHHNLGKATFLALIQHAVCNEHGDYSANTTTRKHYDHYRYVLVLIHVVAEIYRT